MNEYPYSEEQLKAIVQRYFNIEELVWGDAQSGYIVRYLGTLRIDSKEAFEQLFHLLKPLSITPLFRWEKDRQAIILIPSPKEPQPSNARVNLLLFFLTLFSMLFAGALYDYQGPQTDDIGVIFQYTLTHIDRGIPFTVSMLAILLAHEFGHYFMARRHNTQVSLPYYLPFPISPFGTLGAFISLKEMPKNKRVLLDIGIGGPLSGLVVAIPILFYGLMTSTLNRLPLGGESGVGVSLEGNSLFYLFAKWLVFGKLLPQPIVYDTLPLFYWIRYFFTGLPVPWGAVDVHLNAVAWAGWAGLLVTALNLIPVGQLDGGHLLYVLFGNKARQAFPFILASLFILGFVWSGWWIWAALILFFGRTYAEPLDLITPLDLPRKILAVLGLIIFFLIFTPIPLVIIMS